MEINENVIKNMMISYVDHKKILEEFDCEMSEREIEEDAGYQYHKGYCDAAEAWMNAIGVSPNCNFIQDRLNK